MLFIGFSFTFPEFNSIMEKVANQNRMGEKHMKFTMAGTCKSRIGTVGKGISILLVFLLLIGTALLGGCGTKRENGEEPVGTGDSSQEQRQLLTSDLSNYTIIFAESGLSGGLYSEMLKLRAAMEERFGISIAMRDDFIRESSQINAVGELEILIGDTNREESRAVYRELRKDRDYEIRLCGQKVVLASLSKEGLILAVQSLIDRLPEAGSAYFFRKDMELSVKGDYVLEELLLNGADISSYKVVYEDNAVCRSLASQVTELVRKRSGYVLPQEAADGELLTGACILIGDTGAGLPADWDSSCEGYYAGASGANLLLYGAEVPQTCRAVELLLNALETVDPNTASIEIRNGTVLCANTAMTSMSFNLLVSNCTPERIERVLTMIRKHMPDTLGVQEASETWMEALRQGLGEEYAPVGVGRDSGGKGEHSAIFYRTACFTVVESGTKWLSSTPDVVSKVEGSICNRVFTYAILRRNSDEKQFLCINTHTDHTKDGNVRLEQVKVLMEFVKHYSDLPVVISGDFNDTALQPSIQYVLNSGMKNASKLAFEASDTPTFKTSVIDYFFLSADDFSVYTYAVDDALIDGEAPSDHNPVLITYDLAN